MTPPCSGAVPGAESKTPAVEQDGATYDIAFAGAGLAALSLAVRLAALPDPPRIMLIDPRREPVRDRTWCYWQLHDTPFDSAITRRWHRWAVRTPTAGTVTAATVHTPYVRIPADQFHHLALEKLSACPQVEFIRGVSVRTIDHHPVHTTLHLSDGQHITAAWTFDSRPPENNKAPWRQIFRGLELHSPEANLDTTTVTLMDFQSADSGGIRFFYVLPLDPQTALVEDTWLVPSEKSLTFSNEEILSYARKNLSATTWQVRHQEEGNLPMGLIRDLKIKNRIIPWGTAAGAVRTSSGYAFSRIQRASETMTQYWSQHRSPDPAITHESKLLAWMDRVFLRAMTRHPERVPAYFTRLFDRVPPDTLIRFLESEPRPADILQVMRALPPAPFLAAALR